MELDGCATYLLACIILLLGFGWAVVLPTIGLLYVVGYLK